MKLHPSVTPERVLEAVELDDLTGFCVKCGEDAYSVEPDARDYECEGCGERGVYGAQELLFHLVA